MTTTLPGLFLVGLPESTLEIVQQIGAKTGLSEPEVVSEAIRCLAVQILKPAPAARPADKENTRRLQSRPR